MRRAIAVVAGLIVLAAVNWNIAARERLVTEGRVILLALAPVDPRSLMQGDYMALRFAIASEALGAASVSGRADGRLVVAVAADGAAMFRRLDDGTPLAANEARIRYRVRDRDAKIASNAFFFEEGRAGDYSQARYGELRVADDGEAILTGLRDAQRRPLGR